MEQKRAGTDRAERPKLIYLFKLWNAQFIPFFMWCLTFAICTHTQRTCFISLCSANGCRRPARTFWKRRKVFVNNLLIVSSVHSQWRIKRCIAMSWRTNDKRNKRNSSLCSGANFPALIGNLSLNRIQLKPGIDERDSERAREQARWSTF